MKSTVEVETERPKAVKRCLTPSLTSDDNVEYSLKASEDCLVIDFEAGTLGHLRGTSDTVYRLLSLSKKIIED